MIEKFFNKNAVYSYTDGIYVVDSDNQFAGFESAYIDVRKREGRLLDDKDVLSLPEADRKNPLWNEWSLRSQSAKALLAELECKPNALTILDIGCGNGWFSRLLANINNSTVLAIDVNFTELKQASRLFSSANLWFAHVDLYSNALTQNQFNVITINSAIQYFHDLTRLINHCLSLTKQGGEIHIIDSPIYADQTSANDAKRRTEEYYSRVGTPEMADHYFHHHVGSLSGFNYSILYDPTKNRRSSGSYTPFPWLKITKE